MNNLCKLSQTWGVLFGRILVAAIFLQSGIDKLFNFDKTVKLMTSKAIPMPDILLVPTIVVLLACGVMLLVGWKARWAALALILFMIPATMIFAAMSGFMARLKSLRSAPLKPSSRSARS